MPSITLATYAVRIRARRSPDFLPLVPFHGTVGMDLVIENVLQRLSAHVQDELHQHLIRVKHHTRQGDDIVGVIEAGEYGYSADGVNVRTRKESFQRTPEDAELIPFYFRWSLPPGGDTGLLLLQRYGPHGVFLSLTGAIHEEFEEHYDNFIVDFPRLVPAEVIQDLLKGELKEIEITTYTVPTDIADKYRFLGNKKDVGTFTVAIKAKRNASLLEPPWIKRIRHGRVKVVALPDELGGEKGRVRIRVSYNGKTRTVDMTNPDSIAPYIDANPHVKLEPSGHPTFDSMDAFAIGIRDKLLEDLGRT
jgi:hypothetical protein